MTRRTFRFLCSLILAGSFSAAPMTTAFAQNGNANVIAMEYQVEQPWEPTKAEENYDIFTPVVEIDGTPLTFRELGLLLTFRPMVKAPIMFDWDLPKLRGDDLLYAAKHAAAYGMLLDEAKNSGVEVPEEKLTEAETRLNSFDAQLIYQNEIAPAADDPSEEALRERYEEVKEKQFQIEERMDMAHLIVSTYEPYTVEEGDTLESIAEKVNGDVAVAELILSDETKRPRIEHLEENEDAKVEDRDGAGVPEGEELPPRALTVGELLLVPASGEIVENAKAKIEEAYAKLEAGEDFAEVAKEYSEAANPGRIMPIRPARMERDMMPEILETFMSLDDESHSEPIRTKHGFQIIYRADYTAPGFKTFEESRDKLAESMKQERIQERVEEYFANILNNDSITTIHEDVVTAEVEKDAVPITVNGEDFTYSLLNSKTRNEFIKEKYRDVEEFRDFVWRVPDVQMELINGWKEGTGFVEENNLDVIHQMAKDSLYVTEYLDQRIDEQITMVPDAKIEKYYEDNKETYKIKESYEVRRAILRPVSDSSRDIEVAAEELREKLKGIESAEQFDDLAKNLLPQDETKPAREKVGLLGVQLAEKMEEEKVQAIREVEVPGMTDVVIIDGIPTAFWVSKKTAAGYVPLDEKRENIEKRLLGLEKDRMRAEIVRSIYPEAEAMVTIINDDVR